MIESNLLPNLSGDAGNYNNGKIQCTAAIPDVQQLTPPVDLTSDFTDAYWLGWFDVKKCPSLMSGCRLEKTEDADDSANDIFSFISDDSQSENINIGYFLTNQSNNSNSAQTYSRTAMQYYTATPFTGRQDKSWYPWRLSTTQNYYMNPRLINKLDFQEFSFSYIEIRFMVFYEDASESYNFAATTIQWTMYELLQFLNGASRITFAYGGVPYSYHIDDFNEYGVIDDSYEETAGNETVTRKRYAGIVDMRMQQHFSGTDLTTGSTRTKSKIKLAFDKNIKTDGEYKKTIISMDSPEVQVSGYPYAIYTFKSTPDNFSLFSAVGSFGKIIAEDNPTDSAYTYGQPLATYGYNGHFTRAELFTELAKHPFNSGNVIACRYGASASNTLIGFYRCISPSELYRYCSLFRWYYPYRNYTPSAQHNNTINITGYSDTLVYYPKVDLETNQFLGELVTGNESEIKPLLTDWEKNGIDPTNAPYNPKDKPKPTPVPDDTTYAPKPHGKENGREKIRGDATNETYTRPVTSGSTKYYLMNITELIEFTSALWGQSKTFYNSLKIAGNESIFDYVVSLKQYPFDCEDYFASSLSPVVSDIYLGTGAVFKKADNTNFQLTNATNVSDVGLWCTWDFLDFDFWTDDFLDLNPFTKVTITVPYVGEFDIDTEELCSYYTYMKNVHLLLYYSMDLNSGTCTFYVYTGAWSFGNIIPWTLLAIKTAQLGIDLPISGNNAQQQALNLLQTSYRNVRSFIGESAGIASSAMGDDKLGLAAGIASAITTVGEGSLAYALARKQVPVNVLPSSGSVSSTGQCQRPYITIYRQKVANPSNYGHVTGYRTESTHQLISLKGKGLTVCRNPDLSGITATEEEKSVIYQALTNGIYL